MKTNKRLNSPNTPESAAKKPKRGELNWNPSFAEGEDEASIALHKEFLKSEWRKRARDEEKISQRMEMTFPHRRQMVNDGKQIKEIREDYPALFCQSEVRHYKCSIQLIG